MRRLITAAVLVAALTSVSSASAITDGTADGSAHPNVGGLVAPVAYSDGTWIYCSGTLISPTVFLTAAHCAEASDQVRVTFDTAYQDGDKTYSGTFHGDPAYNQSQGDPHDIAVVVFDKEVKGITPARLPAAASLSNLSSTQQFTSVGYGAYEVTNQPGGHQYRTFLAVPVATEQRAFGVMTIDGLHVGDLTPDDLSAARVFARLLAVALAA